MTSFYERPETERIALTERAIVEQRTLHERWTALAAPEAAGWNARAALAAEWLGGSGSVLDLGCGTMSLETYLADGVRYYPSDVVARDGRTLVCDYNLQPPPVIDADAAVCLGLLEYLHQPLDFMRALAAHYPLCIVDYCTVDAPKPLVPRRAHGWVNDFTHAGIERIFTAAGWRITASLMADDFQFLWRLARPQHGA